MQVQAQSCSSYKVNLWNEFIPSMSQATRNLHKVTLPIIATVAVCSLPLADSGPITWGCLHSSM